MPSLLPKAVHVNVYVHAHVHVHEISLQDIVSDGPENPMGSGNSSYQGKQ
jgi:hypothetical protein